MNHKVLLVGFVALVAAAIVIPAYAHQVHERSGNSATVVFASKAPTHTAVIDIFERFNGADPSEYEIEIPADDLEDARTRFFHDHVVDGIYQFTQKGRDGDRLYLIERTQIVQTRIHMK